MKRQTRLIAILFVFALCAWLVWAAATASEGFFAAGMVLVGLLVAVALAVAITDGYWYVFWAFFRGGRNLIRKASGLPPEEEEETEPPST